jgi:hypothetical protein
MQWPTCLALMTWQLSKQCGLEVDQQAVDRSFQFLDYGTTDAGKIAYGGEFTLNNGPIDSARWKSSTRNGASHKSGLGYLVHSLSPEREDSKKMMKLHISNIDEAYKDMPDGHACALMGLTWGWAGTYASDDAKLKKKVSSYYKAWINMARCHGSDSYVILPGRDRADGSYYRGNIRNHTTAAVAFAYSYSTPKLRIQGQVGNANQTSNSGTSRLAKSKEGGRRTFYSPDRKRSFEGRLVSYDSKSSKVQIRMNNGRITVLELTKLSQEDQQYVEKFQSPNE